MICYRKYGCKIYIQIRAEVWVWWIVKDGELFDKNVEKSLYEAIHYSFCRVMLGDGYEYHRRFICHI